MKKKKKKRKRDEDSDLEQGKLPQLFVVTVIQMFCTDSGRGVKTLPGPFLTAPVKPSKSLGFVPNHVKVLDLSSSCTLSLHWRPSHHLHRTSHSQSPQYYYLLVRRYRLHQFLVPVIQQMSLKISVNSSHQHKLPSILSTRALSPGYEGLKRRISVSLSLQQMKLSLT